MEATSLLFTVLFFAAIIGWLIIAVFLAEKDFRGKKRSSVVGSQRVASQNANYAFLEVVRARSCYASLRNAHVALTAVAIVAMMFLWINLITRIKDAGEGWYATFTCAAVVVALLIEYGLFRLIVDAVDVLIDTGRRAAGEQGDAGG